MATAPRTKPISSRRIQRGTRRPRRLPYGSKVMGRERPNIEARRRRCPSGARRVQPHVRPAGAPTDCYELVSPAAFPLLAPSFPVDADTAVTTLANGVRVVAIREPHLETASASVFVRSGSQHESRRANGISHVVEHMAFKGTLARDCQQIN